MDFDKELKAILEDDPLGLLDIQPKASSVISTDERLLASFEEINHFIENHDREPEASRDITERKLYSRLKGLRENPEKATGLLEFDRFHLLADVKIPQPVEIHTVEDVMADDPLGLLEDSEDIFTLKNIPKSIDMPNDIARRKPCEDFQRFELLFKQCHAELQSGKRELRKFTGEQQISAGHFFILHGVMVYVADVGERQRNKGKVNARLHCVFENGTESDMLLRSLATELYKDENGRRVWNLDDDLLTLLENVTQDDQPTGFIYVLRSLSENPEIKVLDDLYKIGYSSQSVEQRIQNASQEPTYLMADVEVVCEYQTYNLNPQKLELLLHTFFAKTCLNFDIFDEQGRRHAPREWFVVPLPVIETAIQLLINGEIVNYQYDVQGRRLSVND
ncbi:MAG: GIY-YIG nuclease family protein [Endozoicomonadaceae bacterium]|nr:GIY-YIG nuclease family protein [Endozoicomonadaceae bacterium]